MSRTEPAAGEHIGPYEVVRAIGGGPMATVLEARAPDGAAVAVKLLAAGAPAEKELGARFRREIAVLRSIDHPNVVALLDSDLDGTWGPYLVTPYLEGRTLRHLADGDDSLCPEAALLLLADLADGVDAIHRAGMVHRDVKPENAIVTGDGRVVLIDLGLALGPDQTRYTSEGAVVGSVPYMSPEQVEGAELSPASDVWSLGVIAYEWIAGRRPFQRDRHAEEVAAILSGNYPDLDELDRRASPELMALIDACLARDPAQRPATAGALAERARALVDWVEPAQLAEERRALAADPVGYAKRVVAGRLREVERTARRAIDEGRPFDATRAIDRGFAYAPDDPSLRALADRAIAASPPRRRRRSALWITATAIALGAVGGVTIFALRGDRQSSPPTAAETAAAPAPAPAPPAPDAAPVVRTVVVPLPMDPADAGPDPNDPKLPWQYADILIQIPGSQ